jgi:hypothetical protein
VLVRLDHGIRVFEFASSNAMTHPTFKFNKRSQPFVGVHNETLSVAAMRENNPDRSPLRIHGSQFP